ncbi:MAG: FAD-dependent monooxygenase [Pseudomonadota bacterium]
MTLDTLDALVVGCGIGGLASAICLAQRGAAVRILEQAPHLTEVGAGLQVSPNGYAVLDALGLSEELLACSVQPDVVHMIDYKGTPIVRLPLSRGADRRYCLVHRADLLDLLLRRAREAGVEILLSQPVAGVEPGPPARVTTEAGETFSASLVVGADGLHSLARTALNTDSDSFFTGQVAWRALVPEHDAAPDVRLFMGPRRHLVSYPIRNGQLRNIVAVHERSAWARESWSQQDDPISLRQAFADFAPEVTGLLSRVETVHLWGLFRHPVAARWHGGALALLGDAAHPTLPFMAQGANLALEDAWVLADAVSRAATLDAGLAAYQARRQARARRAVEAANRNAGYYHLSRPVLRWAMHRSMRAAETLRPGSLIGRFDWLYRHDVTA